MLPFERLVEIAKKPSRPAPKPYKPPPSASRMRWLEKQEAEAAAHAALLAEYEALPQATREHLLADFELQRATGGTMSWQHFLKIVLPMLPPEARE